jgi:hypothetical protein
VPSRAMIEDILLTITRPLSGPMPATCRGLLLEIHQRLISVLPNLTNAGMNVGLQVRQLSLAPSLGYSALATAIQVDNLRLGVEALEHARALFFSQSLSLRNAQMQDVPSQLREELEDLLRAIRAKQGNHYPPGAEEQDGGAPLLSRDVLYRRASRLQEILGELRTLSGLERFMLGPTFDQLARCCINPIALMICNQVTGTCQAIIVRAESDQPQLLLLDITVARIDRMCLQLRDAGLRARSAGEPAHRQFGVSKRSKSPAVDAYRILAELWSAVVKPVIDTLGLEVNTLLHDRCEL